MFNWNFWLLAGIVISLSMLLQSLYYYYYYYYYYHCKLLLLLSWQIITIITIITNYYCHYKLLLLLPFYYHYYYHYYYWYDYYYHYYHYFCIYIYSNPQNKCQFQCVHSTSMVPVGCSTALILWYPVYPFERVTLANPIKLPPKKREKHVWNAGTFV